MMMIKFFWMPSWFGRFPVPALEECWLQWECGMDGRSSECWPVLILTSKLVSEGACCMTVAQWLNGWSARLTIKWSQVRITLRLLGNFDKANFLYTTLPTLSEETLKAVGPFYLVSMPDEVKYPTQTVNVWPVMVRDGTWILYSTGWSIMSTWRLSKIV